MTIISWPEHEIVAGRGVEQRGKSRAGATGVLPDGGSFDSKIPVPPAGEMPVGPEATSLSTKREVRG